MSRNPELDRLKSMQQSFFEQRQVAFQKFMDLQKQTNVVYDTMQACWDERVRARERMSHEFEVMQSTRSSRDFVWGAYMQIRDRNNSRIESLKHEADSHHRAMQKCFDEVSRVYLYGDKADAPYFSRRGYEHRDCCNALNAEISELAREIKQAKSNAETLAPKTDSSMYSRAKASFELAKSRHELAQVGFNELKSRCDSAKSDLDRLHEQLKQVQSAIIHKLEEVKSDQNLKNVT